MKLSVGIVATVIAFTSVRAGKPNVAVKPPEISSAEVSASMSGFEEGSSSDSSWDTLDSTEDSRSGYSCDGICPTEYEPVCGSDGVTYVNDCALSIAQCDATELTLTATGDCAGVTGSSSPDGSKYGSFDTSCPDACLDVYDPVSDASGKTYSNQCYMRMAKCKDKKKNGDILEAYKLHYGKSFGGLRDGDDSTSGSSSVAMKGAKAPTKGTKSAKSTKTKTSSINFGGVGSLYDTGSDGTIGSDSSSHSSKCGGACPDIYSPVCGSDGVTYSSSCKLELASCQNSKLKLIQVNEDVCAESTTTQQETVSKKATKTT